MSISIEAKPLTIKANIGDYGEFEVRRMGAAVEAECRRLIREYEQKSKSVEGKYKNIFEKETDLVNSGKKTELEEFRSSKEYLDAKEHVQNMSNDLQNILDYLATKKRELFSCDDEARIDRLFNELTSSQIDQIYNQIIAESDSNMEKE